MQSHMAMLIGGSASSCDPNVASKNSSGTIPTDKAAATSFTEVNAGTKQLTISVWVKLDQGTAPRRFGLVAKTSADLFDHGLFFNLRFSQVVRNNLSSTVSEVFRRPTFKWGINDNTFHHYLVSIDMTQTDPNKYKLWRDGILMTGYSTLTTGGGLGTANIPATDQMAEVMFGSSIQDSDVQHAYLLLGQVLDPTSFITGTGAGAAPKTYVGAHGVNDVHLDFCNGANGLVDLFNGKTYSASA